MFLLEDDVRDALPIQWNPRTTGAGAQHAVPAAAHNFSAPVPQS